jgi:O-antigen ligase
MASIIYSPFLLSVSMVGLLLLSLIRFPQEGSGGFAFNKEAFRRIADYRSHLSFLVLPLFFLIVLFSAWQTTGDSGYLLERLRIKLPFLMMPFAFLGLPPFREQQLHRLFLFLLVLMTLSCIGVGIYYWFHYAEVQMALGRGEAMPTPRNHIRFSLLTAVSIIGGLHLLLQKYCWGKKTWYYFIAGMTAFLFVFIHILSVKSGIVCLYFALGVLLLRYIYVSKKILLGGALLLALMLLPLLAYHSIPSLKQKIGYMTYDLMQYQKGAGGIYADSGRITSLKVGLELFQRSPIFGVGAGNLDREVRHLYAEKYPDYVQALMPHNQFLFVMAGTGLFGFFFLVVAFFVPLFYRQAYRHFFFLGFYMISLMAFILEHSIENAAGVGTFVFFVVVVLGSCRIGR